MFDPLYLTKSSTFILGPISSLLGYVMNGIFWVLDKIGIPNIGLAIIIFTIVIYMALMPLTIKQQKFSKLQMKMQPELQAIQAKYKGKKDNDSVMRMNEETQALYKKYGVSPTGSCVQLAIQMPILLALYRVIYNFPGYVTQVKDAFTANGLIDKLISTQGSAEYLQSTSAAAQFARQFTSDNFVNNVGDTVANTFIDVLNRFSTTDWSNLVAKFPDITDLIHNAAGNGTLDLIEKYNNFLGLNIGNSPMFTFKEALSAGSVIGIIAAVIVPILAAVTQLINVALMPQPGQNKTGNDQADQMAASMKTMNYVMPVMSAWFCFTLPAGMGLYWIAGSVIRSVQQVLINRSIDSMDMDAYIKKQVEKAKIKAEKRGDKPTAYDRMMQYSQMSTKNVDTTKVNTMSDAEKQKKLDDAKKYYDNGKYKKGSLASKANMVKTFNDVNKSN